MKTIDAIFRVGQGRSYRGRYTILPGQYSPGSFDLKVCDGYLGENRTPINIQSVFRTSREATEEEATAMRRALYQLLGVSEDEVDIVRVFSIHPRHRRARAKELYGRSPHAGTGKNAG